MSESESFQNKYRPKKLSELVGQAEAVKMIQQFQGRNKMPHSFLLIGPPGVGKTTTARILGGLVGCKGTDLREINAANERGIDGIRTIEARLKQKPLLGKSRGWIFDEVHQLSRRKDGDAQTALLKMLEEPPDHAYFFLCTTDPGDLLPAIRSRCSMVVFQKVKDKDMTSLVKEVCLKEKIELEDGVLSKLIKVSEGDCRTCLKLLDQIVGVKGEDDRIDCLDRIESEKHAIDLCRALASPKDCKWVNIKEILKGMKDSEPEGTRRAILGYFAAIMLNANGSFLERAKFVIDCFRDTNFMYDGRAGLYAACFEACRSK